MNDYDNLTSSDSDSSDDYCPVEGKELPIFKHEKEIIEKMEEVNYEEVYSILKKYNFEIVTQIQNNFLCIVCGKLLIDACAGVCGCRYCYGCIKNHLILDVVCPGCGDNNRGVGLDLEKDIIRDSRVNERIAQFVVKCPFQSCSFEGEICGISNHLLHCSANLIICPFISVGCLENKLRSKDMTVHMEKETFTHSKLTIDSMENLKNDICCLKNVSDWIQHQASQLSQKCSEIESKQETTSLSLLHNIENLIEEMKELRKSVYLSEKQQRESNERITLLEQHLATKTDHISRLQADINELKDLLTFYKTNDPLNPDDSLLYYNECYRSIDDFPDKFVWKISNFREVWENFHFWENLKSPSFYSHYHGYKMRLELYPCIYLTGWHVAVTVRILKGDFDGTLTWPFKKPISISLMDQKLGLVHKTKSVTYTPVSFSSVLWYAKPISDENDICPDYLVVKWYAVVNNDNVLRNNSLVFTCSVDST